MLIGCKQVLTIVAEINVRLYFWMFFYVFWLKDKFIVRHYNNHLLCKIS